MALGFKAAQLGVPYLACKSLLGSDIVKYNPYVKVIDNPFKKKKTRYVLFLPFTLTWYSSMFNKLINTAMPAFMDHQ